MTTPASFKTMPGAGYRQLPQGSGSHKVREAPPDVFTSFGVNEGFIG